jgi:hypothetical protein
MIAKNPAISKLIMRHINYYDDYQRLLERLAENYSGNAAQAIRHWNERCFGRDAEAFMARRLGLR